MLRSATSKEGRSSGITGNDLRGEIQISSQKKFKMEAWLIEEGISNTLGNQLASKLLGLVGGNMVITADHVGVEK